MKNVVLVISVHPDDETLGCGGTLLKYKSQKDDIHWLICTSLDSDHKYYCAREEEIKMVSKAYGFSSVHQLKFKTTLVDTYSMNELVSNISSIIVTIKPNIVYLPFKNDIHSDHKKIFEAGYSCTKIFRYPFLKKIYMMETVSETEFSVGVINDWFVPNVFVDITPFLEKKIEIMSMFKSEISEHPFPRSSKNLRALATFRGSMCGSEYAESFMLVKEIS